MSSLHGLALLCGMCCVSLGWAYSKGLASPNMNEDIKKVEDHFINYSKKNKSKWFGEPLFLNNTGILDDKLKGREKVSEREKNLLTGEMLGVGQTALSNLLNHTKDEEIRMTISAIKGRVEELQKEYFPAMKQDLRRRLQDLWSIKADEFMTQLQAVRELMVVYSKASKMGNAIQVKKRRRRRQVHQTHSHY